MHLLLAQSSVASESLFVTQVWAAVVNVGVTIILSIPLSIMGVGSTFTSLEMPHVNERFGSKGGHLSIEKVREIMGEAGTREPIKVS